MSKKVASPFGSRNAIGVEKGSELLQTFEMMSISVCEENNEKIGLKHMDTKVQRTLFVGGKASYRVKNAGKTLDDGDVNYDNYDSEIDHDGDWDQDGCREKLFQTKQSVTVKKKKKKESKKEIRERVEREMSVPKKKKISSLITMKKINAATVPKSGSYTKQSKRKEIRARVAAEFAANAKAKASKKKH